jgi:hypothetical protein
VIWRSLQRPLLRRFISEGHLDNGRGFMKLTGMVPNMLDKSLFNRRLHQVSELVVSIFLAVRPFA